MPRAPYFLAVDSDYLVDADGRRPLTAYVCAGDKTACTLTQREADLVALAHPGMRPPQALEALHPWLPPQKFRADAARNWLTLQKLVRRYGQHFLDAADACDARWATVCNAVRRANNLDARFQSAWHLPLQQAYVLAEARPDRTVVAIDFNSLYAACMQQDFPAPAHLYTQVLNREAQVGETLPVGLYRCVLGGEVSRFMRQYNPFRGFFSGRYLGVSLDGSITVDLNEFEVPLYRRHFSQMTLLEAFVSDRIVCHPLAREARRAYFRRQHFKKQGNKALADREKYVMTLLASCTSRPGRETNAFASERALWAWLQAHHGMVPHAGEPRAAWHRWLRDRHVMGVDARAGGLTLLGPAQNDGFACHSLGQRIVARARTRVLEEMERIVKLGSDIEICYCNIDSIHFSVSQAQRDTVLSQVTGRACDSLGGYKVEAVTQYGLWLEPGRYWLYGDTVEKFGNRGIGDGTTPFVDSKVYVASRYLDGLHVPVRARIDLAGSMSDAQGLAWDAGVDVMRQTSVGLHAQMDYMEVLARLEVHRRVAVPCRLDAFAKLQAQIEPKGDEVRLATLPRCGANMP